MGGGGGGEGGNTDLDGNTSALNCLTTTGE